MNTYNSQETVYTEPPAPIPPLSPKEKKLGGESGWSHTINGYSISVKPKLGSMEVTVTVSFLHRFL